MDRPYRLLFVESRRFHRDPSGKEDRGHYCRRDDHDLTPNSTSTPTRRLVSSQYVVTLIFYKSINYNNTKTECVLNWFHIRKLYSYTVRETIVILEDSKSFDLINGGRNVISLWFCRKVSQDHDHCSE